MAALDRLDDLETFLLGAARRTTCSARARMWQLPLGGLRDYTLPATIAERLGGAEELGAALAAAPRSSSSSSRPTSATTSTRTGRGATSSRTRRAHDAAGGDGPRDPRVGRGQRTRPADPDRRRHRDGRRLGAELPARARGGEPGRRRDRRIPLHRELPAARRARSSSACASGSSASARCRRCAAILAEIRLAEERARRGEPAHYPELIIRLMRVAIARNTVLEERLSTDRETRRSPSSTASATRSIEAAVQAAPPRRRRRAARGARGAVLGRPVPVPHRSRDRPAPRRTGGGRPRSHLSRRVGRGAQARLVERGYSNTY